MQIGAAGVVVLVLAWALWPSRYSKVTNLDSRGSATIAFGDSLTYGFGANEDESYPAHLAAMLKMPVINAGVNGDTTESALARLDDDVLSRNPRMVIVGLGGNDFLRGTPMSTTEANLREIVRRIQKSGAMVVLLGFRFPTLGTDYGTMYERVAEDERCLLVPDVLDGIMADQNLKSDEIHPNAAGYALIAERVAGPAGKLLQAANTR